MLYKAYLVLYKMYIIMQLRRETLKIRLRSHIAARSYVCEAAQQQARTRILFFPPCMWQLCCSAVHFFFETFFSTFFSSFFSFLSADLGFAFGSALAIAKLAIVCCTCAGKALLTLLVVQQLVFLWSRLFWFRLRFGSSPLSLLLRHSSLGWFPLGTAGAA